MEKKKPNKGNNGTPSERKNYSSDKPKPKLPKFTTQPPPSPKKD